MNNYNIGGVQLKDVITFQTQIMMGTQFTRVKNAKNANDIIIACLRLGWNDAFRHTSENVKEGNKTVLELKSASWNQEHREKYDDYICSILGEKAFLDIFLNYAKANSTKKKIGVIVDNLKTLKNQLKNIKNTEGDKQLCFGHYQKMFNIALKLYLCLFMCREYLNINVDLFYSEIIDNLATADCPIDSIILKKLSEKTRNRKFADYKWSKFGTLKNPIDYYEEAQDEISKLVDGNSNLSFDFSEWEKE